MGNDYSVQPSDDISDDNTVIDANAEVVGEPTSRYQTRQRARREIQRLFQEHPGMRFYRSKPDENLRAAFRDLADSFVVGRGAVIEIIRQMCRPAFLFLIVVAWSIAMIFLGITLEKAY